MTRHYRSSIIATVPVMMLLASSLSMLRSDRELGLSPDDTRYLEYGATSTVSVVFDADRPVNAIGATLAFPPEKVAVDEISLSESSLDLWTEQPTVDSAKGTITFSGGSITKDGLVGPGTLFTFSFTALATGTIVFSFNDGQMLAHDGKGTIIASETYPLSYFIRDTGAPSPDVNHDRTVNLLDFGIVSSRLFGTYKTAYDLNQDGYITLADLRILVSQFIEER